MSTNNSVMSGELLKHLGINVKRLRKEYQRMDDKDAFAGRVGYPRYRIEQALQTANPLEYHILSPVGYELRVLRDREIPDFGETRARLSNRLNAIGIHPGLCCLLEAANGPHSVGSVARPFLKGATESEIADPKFGSRIAFGVALGFVAVELSDGSEEFAAWILSRICESVERGDFRGIRLHLPPSSNDYLNNITHENLALLESSKMDGWLHIAVCEWPSCNDENTGVSIEEWSVPWNTDTKVYDFQVRRILRERGYSFLTHRQMTRAPAPPSPSVWPFVSRVQVRENCEPSTNITRFFATAPLGELRVSRPGDQRWRSRLACNGSPEELKQLAEDLSQSGPFSGPDQRSRVYH